MKKVIAIFFLVLFLVPMLAADSEAQRKYLRRVENTCNISIDCGNCHVDPGGGGALNPAGEAFLAGGKDECYFCPDAPGCGGCTPETEIPCDGIDQDCDGADLVDCGDPACANDPTCGCQPETEIPCDGIDQDCDGSDLVDCGDPACANDPSCGTGGCAGLSRGECNNNANCVWVGSKKNGHCEDAPTCVPETEIPCDGIDQDCDGSDLVDCQDPACSSDPSCGCQPETEIPCDGIDQDCDGSDLVDCGDPACASDPACTGGSEAGNCKDGVDNDGNGQTDCADSACATEPSCSVTISAHAGINAYDGPSTCIGCHSSAGNDMLNSVHGSWYGATPDVVNISGNAGKWGASNNYCTDPELADYGCLKCHVSLVGPPTASTANDMDCLQCHNNTYEATFDPTVPIDKVNCIDGATKTYYTPALEGGVYQKYPRFDLMPAGTTMIELARTVHRPDNESCLLACHANAGGGDGIKRGDLDSAMVDPPVSLDVHLSSAGTAQMTCTDCHATTNHKIPGRGNDLRPTDANTMKKCVDCHVGMDSGGGHSGAGKRSEPDRHVARVDCTGCHIKSYGDGIPTEMTRDWTTPKWKATGCEGQGAWVGTTTKGSGVTPTYRFWTGDSWVYDRNGNEGLSPDPDDNGTLRYSYPIGDVNNGKLYPFKVHESINPVEDGTNMTNFDVIEQFMTGCYDDAARSGLDHIGATGPYTWENTKAYQLITHGIGPSTDADDCSKCHGNGRINPDTESMLDSLGYHLKDGDGNGIINDADRLIICSQCHSAKSFKRTWEQMHAHTQKGSGIDCYFCHDVQRPERGLCSPCDPACVAEFVDTNPFPHQCP